MTKNNTETLQQNYINFGHLGNIPQNNVKVFVSKTVQITITTQLNWGPRVSENYR